MKPFAPVGFPEEAVELFRQRVLRRHPDFESFYEPGATFPHEETQEKQRILQKFKEAGGRREVERLVDQRQAWRAVDLFQNCLKVRLKLVNFHGWQKTFHNDKRAMTKILRAFLETSKVPSVDGFTHLCGTIRQAGGSSALDLISTVYWMLNPKEFFPFAASYVKSLASEARFDFPNTNNPPMKLMAGFTLGRIFRDMLAPLEPKDWIDVQSFMWCASEANELLPNEEHEPEEDPEVEPEIAIELPVFDPAERRFWALAAGAGHTEWLDFQMNSIAAIGWDELGDLTAYDSKQEIAEKLAEIYNRKDHPKNDSLACWEFGHVMNPGDIVFVKSGMSEILGYGLVLSDYLFDSSRERYNHVRKVRWISNTQSAVANGNIPRKTLTEITDRDSLDIIKKAGGYIDPEDDDDEVEPMFSEEYSVEDALAEVFLDEDEFEEILQNLREKKNVILQGAPGVGKSFVAKRLAYVLAGNKRSDRSTCVQFHQSYSYEDFIQGFRPNGEGAFTLKNGPFLRFCETALLHQSETFVFIIDEINRGNLSKIFGELMLLIEPDKRDKDYAIPLLYSEAAFFVPPNVHIIGLMNTADRSLALVDYALRRRFRFHTLEPKFESVRFAEVLNSAGADEALIARIRRSMNALNEEIREQVGLGRGYCIGHSYFCPQAGQMCDDNWFQRVVNGDIVPLLEEYWFDSPDKVSVLKTALLS